ncbi:substrate-binding domain-containing protein [Actinoplanes palleronii]|uniref:LacI family transcriptional regulator n=1 Tax=Actinoplanes palleronii TaxID=113570 RepID=A0ABQ4BJ12_9ACTN|nr:substrate-binding domain-containing protein [Actinoplanes palleronii]GIE70666.1 LacI family transcriptional regulator [Actinoplanes palleronii]
MNPVHVLNAQRRERILAELQKHGAVRVVELAEEFGVSAITVRRDIALLAHEKRLVKVHGGALPLPEAPRRAVGPPARLSIGMIVPTLDFFWPAVIGGARTAAAMLGVDLRLRGSSYDPGEDQRQIAQLLGSESLDGVLLAPDVHDDLSGISTLRIPCVLMERAAPVWGPGPQPLESVRNDHDAGVESALQHLARQGHRRIGLVVTPISPNAQLIEQGFTRGEQRGPIIRDTLRGDPARAGDVLDACRATGTTALIVHSDPDAITLIRAATARGIRIPDELALVSYDDEVAQQADPPLTAVRPAKGQIGRMAVEMLVLRLGEGNRRPANRLQLVPNLIVRGTSVPHAH